MGASGQLSITSHPSFSIWLVISRSRSLWTWHPESIRQCYLQSAGLTPKLWRTSQQTTSRLQIIPKTRPRPPAATRSTWPADAKRPGLTQPCRTVARKEEQHGFVFKQIIAQAAPFPSLVSVNVTVVGCWLQAGGWPRRRGMEAAVPFAPCYEAGR